jgi:predicted secreted Zn-dependent protease
MQKKTRSILDELNDLHIPKDKTHLVESRASNIIQSAINLFEQIDMAYDRDQADDLQRKFVNAIKTRDPKKFYRSVRRKDED